MCKVSVIVPVHNSSRTLNKCVDSIVNQTYSDLEIILVENLSQDTSLQICEDYAKLDSRVKVLSLDTAGISKARNAGLKQKTGEYFIFVDSDDYIETDMIEKLLNEAKRTQSEMVFCRIKNVKSDGEIFYSEEKHLEDVIFNREIKYLFLIGTAGYVRNVIWRILYKSDNFNGLFFDEEMIYHEDADFLFKAFMRTKKSSLVNEPLYVYSSFYDKPEVTFKKYFLDINADLETFKRFAISSYDLCKEFGLDDFANAALFSKYIELASIILKFKDYRAKFKLLNSDVFWQNINTNKNYRTYQKYFSGYSKLKIYLLKNKQYTFCKFLMNLKKLVCRT